MVHQSLKNSIIMKRAILFMALMVVFSCAFAQHHRDRGQKETEKTETATVVKKKGNERRTGATRKYTYKIDKVAVESANATDVKMTITANTANHKLMVKCDRNDGGISWKLFGEDGTVLDENWWSGKETKLAFGRYGEGTYFINFIDALGKEARYKVTKKISE